MYLSFIKDSILYRVNNIKQHKIDHWDGTLGNYEYGFTWVGVRSFPFCLEERTEKTRSDWGVPLSSGPTSPTLPSFTSLSLSTHRTSRDLKSQITNQHCKFITLTPLGVLPSVFFTFTDPITFVWGDPILNAPVSRSGDMVIGRHTGSSSLKRRDPDAKELTFYVCHNPRL